MTISRFLIQYSIFTLFVSIATIGAVSSAAELSITDDGKALTVMSGEKVVLKYNIATVPSPDENKPYFARSGHIHPVCTPQGHAVTGDMCPDHVHQHAIWFAWTSSQYDGRKVDFWNSAVQQGRIEHAEVLDKEWSDDEATFRVRLNHIDLTGAEPQTVLNETWTVSVRPHGDVYVIDLESKQKCTTDKPLVIKQYHYGAMGLRSPMAWNAPDGGLLTSEGKTRENGNHTRPDWVDSFGPVTAEKQGQGADAEPLAGVTVMQHPANFRYPQPVRLHPKFSYFCFAPMVLGDFEIKPGQDYVSRFRYVVHDGAIDKEVTKTLWDDFVKRYPSKREAGASINIRIDADGSLAINSKAVTKDQISARMKSAFARLRTDEVDAEDVIIRMTVHPQVALGKVIEIQQLAQQAGTDASYPVNRFVFATSED